MTTEPRTPNRSTINGPGFRMADGIKPIPADKLDTFYTGGMFVGPSEQCAHCVTPSPEALAIIAAVAARCGMARSDEMKIALAIDQHTERLREQLNAAIAGLNIIAVWDEGPVVNGTFDNPFNARTARETIARCKSLGIELE
jgi:hypothetical protein